MSVHLSLGDTDLVRTIADFLGEFAANDKQEHADENGVEVLYSQQTPRLVALQ